MRRLKKLSKSHSVTGTQESDAAPTTTAATTTAPDAATLTDANGNGGSVNKDTLLNTDIFKHFDKSGRNELYVAVLRMSYMRINFLCTHFPFSSLKYLKQQLQDSPESPVFDRHGTFKRGISNAIYELLWQALRYKLKKDVVLHVLTDVVVSTAHAGHLKPNIYNLISYF